MDPTSAVARTEHLVLWSRLGTRFRVADLERMLWDEHSLFEYWAHIVPVDDYDIHRESMRRFRRQVPGEPGRRVYWREWMAANAAFRRYVLRELRRRGPLRTRDLEDRAAEGWQTGGWNDQGKSTAMMLELLWARGEVMVAGRDGQLRLWDLAERSLPVDQPRSSPTAIARRVVEGQLRARGRGHAEADRLDVRRASSRVGPRARPAGPRGRRDPGPRRRPQRSLVRPRRCGRSSVPAAHDAPVAVRRPGVRPRPHRGACSTSGSGSRSTCRRRSASSATSCCRSCTANG